MRRWHGRFRYVAGTGLCVSAAAMAAIAFRGSGLAGVLPLFFLVVVIVVAELFGSGAGILGTLAAALIFAELLFAPLLSIRVGDAAERNALIWMVLGGIIGSELLGKDSNRPDPRTASHL
jgi:K+-sensing histidine kinase KdpD